MDLYSEIILDYFKNPRNKGPLENASISTTELNPLCGDQITAHLQISKEGLVEKATYEGVGCAISQAAVSMLTESLIGKTLNEIKNMENEEIFKMLNVSISPGRAKCALLGLVAFKKAAIIETAKNNSN
jgi:nitrogen fixation NifU-like protein